MEKLEKVEQVREKCHVSYEEAREALEACDYDVLEAIITIERNHIPVNPTAVLEDVEQAEAANEVVEAQAYVIEDAADDSAKAKIPHSEQANNGPADPTVGQAAQAKESKAGKVWNSFWNQVKQIARSGMNMMFVAERKGERVLALPVLILVIGMLVWGATLWLLIIGLFFDFRYHVEGAAPFAVDVNEVMDKAADVAEDLKDNLA